MKWKCLYLIIVVLRRQAGTVSGHYGPSQATGTSDSRHESSDAPLECRRSPKQKTLKERNIVVWCMQETHLNSSQCFSIRGYETFRRDRKYRPKGRILTLVKNTHAATEVYRSEDEDTEVLGIKLLLDKNPHTIYNLYSPLNKQLRPQVFHSDPDRLIIMGDFNSHSQAGAMMILIIKEMK